LIIATTEAVAGMRMVKVLGLVRGSTVRARHLGRDFLAGLRTLVGGEVIEYTRLLAEAREEAVGRMEESAEELGANAIVSMRLMTSMVIGGAAEILAYGTAVLVKES
jgi:uncharacterized protein YbjQ (UPF0145 family)